VATGAEAADIARLLGDFNEEYDEPSPDPEWLAARLREVMATADTAVMLIGAGAIDGLAVMRFRPSLSAPADECYLAELYIRPALRGQGLGRQLLTAAMTYAARRGAHHMDLSTTNEDTAAVALYESLGFDRHERRGPDTTSYYYEIDLPGLA
jgi:ribosomal protein S18 acetylase RimI-like enzyme